jgi:glycosyltransferase involved in cell wall biosynthesis
MKKHLLHICSDYSKQGLYKELILNISESGISQTVFVPVRSTNEIGKFDIVDLENVSIIYSKILDWRHRLFFKYKVETIFNSILEYINPNEINLIHAHFLFSDGAVADRLKQQYNIPYVVSVRNTDINYFFKWALHLRKIGIRILENSSKIILITPSYKKIIVEKYCDAKNRYSIESKIYLFPNGISKFWLEENIEVKQQSRPLRILYVGDSTKNKNLTFLINTLSKLRNEIDLEFTMVGFNNSEAGNLIKFLENKSYSFVKFIGRINDKFKLKSIYQNHDIFIMISKYETFGLVYLEALSQGLPIIHSRGQGIDGYLKNSLFARAVDYNSEEQVHSAIKELMINYSSISAQAIQAAKKFDWEYISKDYNDLYNKVLNHG